MVASDTAPVQVIHTRIQARESRVAVIGLGFTGASLASACAAAGMPVVGVDVNKAKVGRLARNDGSDLEFPASKLAEQVDHDRVRVTTNYDAVAGCDVVIMCVPIPLGEGHEPDFTIFRAAVMDLAARMDHQPRLIVIESTCPPGTTRTIVQPLLEAAGLRLGHDFFLGYAPERLDAGNSVYTFRNTPRLVGGVTDACLALTQSLFTLLVDKVEPVSSIEVAESAKLMENTFRFVNISLVNEMAQLCDRLGIDVWEVIRAAATKPFGFLAHYPGPGVGGACIPVVPHYLSAVGRSVGAPLRFVELAAQVNEEMPEFVVAKLERALSERGLSLAGCGVLVLGVTYKANALDMRETPAIPLLEVLRQRARAVGYHDPHMPEVALPDGKVCSLPLNEETLRDLNVAVVVTPHAGVDYQLVVRQAALVLDTRNALRHLGHPNVVPL